MSTTEVPRQATDTTDVTPPAALPPAPRGRRGWRTAIVVVTVVAAAGVTVAVVKPFDRKAATGTIQNTAPTGLAQVTKGTLSARTMENGTLGYVGKLQIVGKASGTITRLPAVGDIIGQGKPLYRVDNKPVIFLKGTVTPAYRELKWGMEGADVRQLNAALVALKYANKKKLSPKSDYFGARTYYALVRLQKKMGLKQTGTLPLGQALFVPADEIRVTKVSGVRGTAAMPGSVVLEGSSTRREVTVALNAYQQSDVVTGDKVLITLPTGKTTPGEVSSVGKVAEKKNDDSTTITVRIRPEKPKDTGRLDQAPVQVSIVTDTAKDVLSVPVNALLALAGGGYALEVVEANGSHRLIPVEVGLFDDAAGVVEVRGEGLQVGQNVVVPAS
ncbi:efflux RND transporter periplasmic adaptor subunit [Microbispora cellulosiformans]|uniref:Efflux RND transporter periplasmic adaptor subunit n=1 Tax=Microbispora cellulosiformans TaxID=2614688 RepID=A0A5J5JTR4_9ACTN|nr:peptidoglycan-binding protein [Microbispora cellulosiformans]KAA9374764.1 efflux RND transporter periplasmic adaptor subunit [Microbispora cellulosiformans]